MKIGILTLPYNNNYGGYLQSYALMRILKEMGHSPEIISRRHNKRKFIWRIVQFIKRLLKKCIGKKIPCIIPSQEIELRVRGEKMFKFVDKYISPRTISFYTSKDYYKYINGRYDAIIVGSDQVWRPNYGPHIQDYFLSSFSSDKTMCIAYAASFGSDNPIYTKTEIKECGDAIKKFKAISLREDSGINVIRSFGWETPCEIEVVLDPTLLLNKESYVELLPSGDSPAKGKVFCYVLDNSETVRQVIIDICKDCGVASYHIINTSMWKRYDYIMPSVEDWLKGILEAKYVITDSFHGAVFSILFNKDFFVCGNEMRGKARFLTLLSKFGLEDRFVDMSMPSILQMKPIDWNYVNNIIHDMRIESLAFIERALKK